MIFEEHTRCYWMIRQPIVKLFYTWHDEAEALREAGNEKRAVYVMGFLIRRAG